MIITGRTPGEQTCWSEPWTGFSARTGHFAALEQPEILVSEIRTGLRTLRS